MRIGLVGCGLMGERRTRALLAHGDELVACYDKSAYALEAFRTKIEALGARAWGYDSVKKVCQESEAVIVATTHDALSPTARIVLEHGKHLFLEKPGAMCAEQLETVYLKDSQVMYIAYTLAHHPAFQILKESIGTYGRILYLRGVYGHGGRPGYGSEWRCDPAKSGGGQLFDQGLHLVHLFQALTGQRGEVLSAHARSIRWNPAVEDNVWFTLKAGDVTGQFHASWTERPVFRLEVVCERGQATWEGLGGSYGQETLTLESSHAVESVTRFEREVSLANEWRAFRAMTVGDPDERSNFQEAKKVLELVEDVQRATGFRRV